MVSVSAEPEPMQRAGAGLSLFRDAPDWAGRRTAALGRFRCDTAQAGAALIDEAVRALAAEGFEAVIGPMDGSTWAAHRLVVQSDGRPPFVMEPHNPDVHVAAFEASGLQPVAHWISAAGPAAHRSAGLGRAVGLTLRSFDLARAEDELRRLHTLSLAAFANNFLYRPITREAFAAGYQPVLGVMDPDLVLMVEDAAGTLQAFLVAIPDLSQGARASSVILKTYASLRPGAGSMLVAEFYRRAAARGFAEVIHATMHEPNLSARHSAGVGGRVFRRYALWGQVL